MRRLLPLLGLLLVVACDERWQPADAPGDCDIKARPTIVGSPLWGETFKGQGWAAGCLRIVSNDLAIAKAVKVDGQGAVWSFDKQTPGPLSLQLPESHRGTNVSFHLVVLGDRGQGLGAATPAYCNEQLAGKDEPCSGYGARRLCWFSMRMQLALGGSLSAVIPGHPGRSCVLYGPRDTREQAAEPIVDSGPSERPNTPLDAGQCRIGLSRACRWKDTCVGLQYCTNDGVWGECIPPEEICGNVIDDDCNGVIDDGCNTGTCQVTTPGYVTTVVGRPKVKGQDVGSIATSTFDTPQDILLIPGGASMFVSTFDASKQKSTLHFVEGRWSGSGSISFERVTAPIVPFAGGRGSVGGLALIDATRKSLQLLAMSPLSGRHRLLRLSSDGQVQGSAVFEGNGWGVGVASLFGRAVLAAGDAIELRDINANSLERKPLGHPIFGVAVLTDEPENLRIVYTSGTCVRSISKASGKWTSGTVLAGSCDKRGNLEGKNLNARFGSLGDIVVSPGARFLYVADRTNHKIWRISLFVGQTLSYVGGGRAGHRDACGLGALFHEPVGLDVGEDGFLYIADTGNHVIRRATTP